MADKMAAEKYTNILNLIFLRKIIFISCNFAGLRVKGETSNFAKFRCNFCEISTKFCNDYILLAKIRFCEITA